MQISYHLGEGRIPSIIGSEAINNELNYIKNVFGFSNIVDAKTGTNHIIRTGKILEALKRSLENNGCTVRVAQNES